MRLASISFCLFIIVTAFCSIANSGDLVVGIPMLEPYATQREGEVSGIHVDLVKAVFRHMGENCIIRVMPVNRVAHELMNGTLDVTVMANAEPLLSKVAYLTKVPLSYGQMALLEQMKNPLTETASVLPENASIGAIFGSFTKSNFLAKYKVTWVNSREQLLKILFADRVQYIMAEESITSSFARQRNFPPLANVLLLENRSFHTVFSKLRLEGDAESLGRRFDASLAQIIQQGDWRIITERYSKTH